MRLPDAEDVVAHDGGAVADEEDASFALGHQQVGRVLARHRPEVPTA